MRDWERVSGEFLGNLFQPPQQGKFCPARLIHKVYEIDPAVCPKTTPIGRVISREFQAYSLDARA